MNDFILDQKLAEDCITLGIFDGIYLLLMNNSLAPWFILVPQIDVYEFYELDKESQIRILEAVNSISKFIKFHYQADKLNIATIGNIVKQLHVHIIGRKQDDYCWPGVVWGVKENQPYSEEQINSTKNLLLKSFKKEFTLSPETA